MLSRIGVKTASDGEKRWIVRLDWDKVLFRMSSVNETKWTAHTKKRR